MSEQRQAPWLSLAGTSMLVFGGAYSIRALTESHVLPQVGGVAAGVAYAAIWLLLADRAARRGRARDALFHAATGAAIVYPLVWETVTRFHYVTPAAGGAVAAAVGIVLTGIAWRNGQQSIAWIGSTGAIAVILAIVSPDQLVPLMIAGSIAGAASLHVSLAMNWTFVAWPLAFLANTLAVMTVGVPLLRGVPFPAGRTIAALVVYAGVWLATICLRRLRHAEDLSLFDICDSALLLLVGAGGAALVAVTQHTATGVLGALFLATGVFGYAVALTRKPLGTELRAWFSAGGGYLLALGIALVLPALALISVAYACVAAAASAAATQVRAAVPIQSALWLIFAAVLAAFGGPISLQALAVAVLAVLTFFLTNARPPRMTALAVIAVALFFFSTASLPPDPPIAALIRTAVLAILAALLAVAGLWVEEAIPLSRAVLVVAGLKLLVEDVRLGRSAFLVVGFSLYGAAMLAVSRISALRHTSGQRSAPEGEAANTVPAPP